MRPYSPRAALMSESNEFVAVEIPSYKVKAHILDVIKGIDDSVSIIFVVDDACPEHSGAFVKANCKDPRLHVLTHSVNKGVGGAVMTGYRAALAAGATVVVKLDGDGQMDPALIPELISPLVYGEADYVKGNRFQTLYAIRQMPTLRLIGNAGLSFMSKMSSGYWSIFDPTNGFTAIHRVALSRVDLTHVAERYFFESDLLVKLGDIGAVVVDFPMASKYGDEVSNLTIHAVFFGFPGSPSQSVFSPNLLQLFLAGFQAGVAQSYLGDFPYPVWSWRRYARLGTVRSLGHPGDHGNRHACGSPHYSWLPVHSFLSWRGH